MWINDDSAFDYRFLATGALEYQDRQGLYRITWGAAVADWHEFWAQMETLGTLIQDAPEDETIDRLYLLHPRFQHAANRALTLSGIDPAHIAPRLVRWLLFPASADTPAPLVQLNTPSKPHRPPLLGGEPITGRVGLLVALASVCDGNLAEAAKLAQSLPAREAFAALEEINWARASQEQKDKAVIEAERQKIQASWGDVKAAYRKRVREALQNGD